jgi:hypothetical protein
MQLRGRIRAYLNRDPGFSARMVQSYRDFMRGEINPFVGILEDFFRKRVTRSLAVTNESNLEMAIELLWFEEAQCVPQLSLVMDSTKDWRKGRGGFLDIFVGNSLRQLTVSNPVIVMELKHVTLLSLWKAGQPTLNIDPKSSKDYDSLVTMLRGATEDQLLAMKYTYFDKDKRIWITLQVKDTLQAATVQLNEYMNVISGGRVTSTCPGVLDDRIMYRDGGCDILLGYVVISVGGTRVLCRSTAKKATFYSFEVVHPREPSPRSSA